MIFTDHYQSQPCFFLSTLSCPCNLDSCMFWIYWFRLSCTAYHKISFFFQMNTCLLLHIAYRLRDRTETITVLDSTNSCLCSLAHKSPSHPACNITHRIVRVTSLFFLMIGSYILSWWRTLSISHLDCGEDGCGLFLAFTEHWDAGMGARNMAPNTILQILGLAFNQRSKDSGFCLYLFLSEKKSMVLCRSTGKRDS